MKIVQQRWLAYATNAKTHVKELVDQTLTAQFYIIGRIAFATVVLLVIHSPGVVKSFYVRISSFHSVGFRFQHILLTSPVVCFIEIKRRRTIAAMSPIALWN